MKTFDKKYYTWDQKSILKLAVTLPPKLSVHLVFNKFLLLIRK